jgi:hypothetical protein
VSIGTDCGGEAGTDKPKGDAACILTLTDDRQDESKFCHPTFNTCAKSCNSDTPCPPAWVCDARQETLLITDQRPFCMNPTCGAAATM